MITIAIDSREQRPLQFSDAVQTVRGTLSVGDYSILGLEDQVVIERKSLGDLLGSITSGRERFVKELRQLRAFQFAALVVESSWWTIESGIYGVPSGVHPNSVVGSLMSFVIKYGVVPILADDHDTAGRLVERLLTNYARIIEKDYRALGAAPTKEDRP